MFGAIKMKLKKKVQSIFLVILSLCLAFLYAPFDVLGNLSRTDTVSAESIGRNYSITDDLTANIIINRVQPEAEGIDAEYKLLNQGRTIQNVIAIFAAYDAEGRILLKESRHLKLQPDIWEETAITLPLSNEKLSDCAMFKAFAWQAETRIPLTTAAKKTDLYGNVIETLANASLFSGYDVNLTGDSYFKEQLEIGAKYLKYYDVDRLAASLYVNNMSSKSPAQVYGGWEGGGLPGHSVGHYLSACVSMYMQTGDEDFKDRVDRLVYLIGEAQYDDGYVGGAPKSQMDNVFDNPDTFWAGGYNNAYLDGMWAPWYSIHKIYGGLIDAYLYMGNEETLRIAEGMAAYAKNGTDKLSDERMDYMLEGEYGGINESFAQLYEITGNEDYLILAKRFSHKRIMDPLSRGEDNLSGLHANTQIPKMIGAAKIYQLTGDEYYKNVAENFWHFVVYDRSYATGGNCDKEFFTELGTEPRSVDSTETCNVYNMLKLTEYLYSMEPKTEYIEYYENALYNHILGSQNQVGDKTYNIDLTMGGHKTYRQHFQDFSCCEGTGMENPGRFYRMIYTQAGDGLCVNLFIDSQLKLEKEGILLKQTTDFPYSDESTLLFEQAQGKEIPVKIRIPKWAKDPQITVNGKAVDSMPGQDGYVTIINAWKAGDKIKLTMPMDYSLYVSREDTQGKVVAFKYGPILLAGELGNMEVPYIVTETRNPAEILKKDTSGKLRFSINDILQPGAKSITLKPFFEFISEKYMVYWNLYTPQQYDSSVGEKDAFTERLDSASYDMVQPNDPQSEAAHNLQITGNSLSGTWQEKGWRSAEDVSSFSYDLKVKPTSVNYLLSVFYGNEYSNNKIRTFDILVDNELLGTYTLNYNRPNDPWEYYYLEIPSRLTDGKEKVTVTYRSNAQGYTAGGVFEVRTVSTELFPYSTGNTNTANAYIMQPDTNTGYFKAAGADTAHSEINVSITGQDTARVQINSKTLGNSEISVVCYRPGWNKNINDWENNLEYIEYLDQYSLKDGKTSFEFMINKPFEAGQYTLVIGTGEGIKLQDFPQEHKGGHKG